MSTYESRSLEEIVYTSRFRRWDDRASVRVKPRRLLAERTGEVYFPLGLVPIATHPLVAALGPEAVRHILAQRLVQYLQFTADLEQRLVNPMCVAISRDEVGLQLPEAMRADAFNIYTDEAYHAQTAHDIQRQVAAAAGIADLGQAPALLERAANLARHEPEAAAGLGGLFLVICSETLISAILSSIPSDPTVVPAVRELVADHAIDEAVHHTYFAKLLLYAWAQLSPRQRAAIALRLPAYIRALLDPDLAGLAAILADVGLGHDDIGDVLSDSYRTTSIEDALREDSRITMRHLRRAGVLQVPGAEDAFARAGLA